MSKQTVAEALNISEEWAVLNRYRIEKFLEENDTISDALLAGIENVRNEEFGETQKEFSDYEKKIAMMGFHLAQEIISMKHSGIAEAIIGAIKSSRE
jgi:hypothetical protein